MSNTKTIMLVGVGGQGTLLASRVLGNLLLDAGYDVKLSEVHGMSQRGGSVVTYVRWGSKVCSPLVGEGEADYIISFELCEAARWAVHLKKGGVLITNTQKILPMPVITGVAAYPEGVEEKLCAICDSPIIVDALTPAMEAGSSRAVNVVLLGVLSRLLNFADSAWQTALAASLKPSLLEINEKAFALGRALYDNALEEDRK